MTWFEWREAPHGDFAVLGDPVAHSWSPRLHQAAYNDIGLTLRYHAIRVPEGELAHAVDRLRALGYQGLNLTTPLKHEAFVSATAYPAECERYQALNTLRVSDMRGTNTDVSGFVSTLPGLGVHAPSRALVLGAGGSARAIAAGLQEHGFVVSLWNRSTSRALALASDLGCELLEHVTIHPEGFHLMVNATSASLQGATLPITWESALPEMVAYDLMYAAGGTPFTREAMEHGVRSCDGRMMLVAQAALSLEWWLGVHAPRTPMLEALP